MSNFAHLHVHSDRSLMDGLNTPIELLVAAKELGQTSLAITDHGTLSAHRNMLTSARQAGMKPILGLEAYISPTDRFDRRPVKQREDNTQLYNHIILIARDQKTLGDLNGLSKTAWEEGYYFKPRIDRELLLEKGSGLIVLSGCMNGLVAKAIERGDLAEANTIALWFKRNFEHFYMEVQPHNPASLNHALLEIADRNEIPSVVTSDCHFASPELRSIEEAMLILSTSPKFNREAVFEKSREIKDIFERYDYLYPDRPISFKDIDVYVSSRLDIEAAMQSQGIDRTDIYENTVRITDLVSGYDYHEGIDLLPRPKGEDPAAILRRKAVTGLKKRGLADKPGYKERLEEELVILEQMNFCSYFLIVANKVAWARSKGIFVGPGRGSGAGSLVNYALEITDVDPIKYGLLFFRFVNPERGDFPDIDVDYEDTRRGEIKTYLTRLYKNVASIATYAEFKDKNVVKDAARVFQVPLGEVNSALKPIETFDDFMNSPNTSEFRNKYPEVVSLASSLRGRIKSSGMHASGFVVSSEPIENFAPIETAKDPRNPNGPRVPIVAANMDEVADIGMIKLDVLGLKALTIVRGTLDAIKARYNKEIDIRNLPLNDPKIYEDLSNGYTRAVFQAEQPAYTSLLMRMGVKSFAELAASNALVRPGAMNTIGAVYLARKNGQEAPQYVSPLLKPFTEETYGCILYQEQVMLACVELGGMTMGEADKVRKIIGKKKDVHEFDQFKDKFVNGASQHITVSAAQRLWHDFEAHAGYSFNKSHAVAYSMVTYWTAWLKHYYPKEFMYAVLKNEGNKDSVTEYLIECKRLGLNVYLPDVNKSELGFSIEKDGIRFGLSDIKFISDNIGSKIMALRPFTSYDDLLEKTVRTKGSGVNSRAISAMNAIGAATFPDNPKTGGERENFYEYLSIPSFASNSLDPRIKALAHPLDEYFDNGIFVVVGMVKKIVRKPGWARAEVVDESGSAGIFTDEHTVMEAGKMYVILVANNRIARYASVDDCYDGSPSTLAQFLLSDREIPEGLHRVVSFNSRTTKAGKKMADAVLSDHNGNMISVLVFPMAYQKAFSKMREGKLVKVDLREKDDGTVFLHSC